MNSATRFRFFAFFALSALLLVYIFYRAANMSLTHDEALTYALIKGDHSLFATANHHVLNTFLMKLSSSVFGWAEWALRLPNVLAFFIYTVFVYRIIKSEHTLIFLLGAFLMLLNPFLIDFFSAARGYGLSVALITGSIYYSFRLSDVQKSKRFLSCFFFSTVLSALGLLANFSTLNLFLLLLILNTFQYLRFARVGKDVALRSHLLIAGLLCLSLVFLAYVLNRIFWLKSLNQLYFGADHLNDTLRTFWFQQYPTIYNFQLMRFITVAVLILSLIAVIFRRSFQARLTKMFLLLSGVVIAAILQRYLLAVRFPTERTSIFLVPLFTLTLVLLIEQGFEMQRGWWKNALTIITVVLMSFQTYNFVGSANVKQILPWYFDMNTKSVASMLVERVEPGEKVGVNWLLLPSMNYYADRYDFKFGVVKDEGQEMLNYRYVFVEDITEGDQVIIRFENTNTALCKKLGQ